MSVWTARARRFAMAVSPPAQRLPAEFHLQRRVGKLDEILTRIPLERRLPGRAIDVGANTGGYTYAFSQVFDFVEAFEPQPWCAAGLADFARSRANVRVHRFGLSDRATGATLHVPRIAGRWRRHLATGLASLTPHAHLPTKSVPIDLVPLDAFGFTDVSVIKIDVEGHEREVLAGARETIERCLPVLILEIEERHLPADVRPVDVFAALEGLGYRGWFVRRDVVEPVESFRVERDQLPYRAAVERGEAVPDYINNFVFEAAASKRPALFFRTTLP